MNLWAIFLTGLTTGGLSCLAVQGGLVASMAVNQNVGEQKTTSWSAVTAFMVAKILIHTVLGFLLGWLGSLVTISLELRIFFQLFTAFFMLATALNLLQVHPIFRWVLLQPPHFLKRLIRKESKAQEWFAPVILGLMTVFIPCGVTQAMEVVAINSGHPISGALTMLAFTLGTTPLFILLGVLSTKVTAQWKSRLDKVASALLIGMALYILNGVLVVVNAPVTFQKLTEPIRYFFSDERFSQRQDGGVVLDGEVQKVSIEILNDGYAPDYVRVKQGLPVQLTLASNGVYSCALSFLLKDFGIKVFLESTDVKTFSFVPEKKGRFTYTCSMGMYTGILEVI